jgi:hypothetical protein
METSLVVLKLLRACRPMADITELIGSIYANRRYRRDKNPHSTDNVS